MSEYDLFYREPEVTIVETKPAPLRQAIKSMIFAIVALILAEIPFAGIFIAPIFAIISLKMHKDYIKKFPGSGRGFLKAGRICAIISFPMCAISTIYTILYYTAYSALLSGGEQYFL